MTSLGNVPGHSVTGQIRGRAWSGPDGPAQVRVDHDVVQVLPGGGVELAAAGDQAQARVPDLAVHVRGGECGLDHLLHAVHGEDRGRPVGPHDLDLVTPAQRLDVEEHRDPGERIDMPEDHRGALLPGRDAAVVPAGQVVVLQWRHRHGVVGGQAQPHHRGVDVQLRDLDLDRPGE